MGRGRGQAPKAVGLSATALESLQAATRAAQAAAVAAHEAANAAQEAAFTAQCQAFGQAGEPELPARAAAYKTFLEVG